jgi:hypothetical protein
MGRKVLQETITPRKREQLGSRTTGQPAKACVVVNDVLSASCSKGRITSSDNWIKLTPWKFQVLMLEKNKNQDYIGTRSFPHGCVNQS